jgi:hypothetical protein
VGRSDAARLAPWGPPSNLIVMKRQLLVVAAAAAALVPVPAAGQTSGVRVTVQAAAGTHLNAGGDTQSLAVGLSPSQRVDLLVSVERSHLPTERSAFGATRGGTATIVSGEIRYFPVTFGRTSPYALVSVGRGKSRPTVNDLFPDPVTNDAWGVLFGAGARVAFNRRLSAFADVRIGVQGELDVVGLRVPIRAGLAFGF